VSPYDSGALLEGMMLYEEYGYILMAGIVAMLIVATAVVITGILML
jgi:hypothetical protein